MARNKGDIKISNYTVTLLIVFLAFLALGGLVLCNIEVDLWHWTVAFVSLLGLSDLASMALAVCDFHFVIIIVTILWDLYSVHSM